jgi:ribonucleoside-diphosphate reductase alpha chain
MRPASPFTDMVAVRAWDTWFRWRDAVGLRDRTIDATWWRVARAIARAEGAHADAWSRRFYDAFSRWQLLPDEALVRTAGTTLPRSRDDVLRVSVNAHAFATGRADSLDGLAEAGTLAVRILDDARKGLDAPPGEFHVCLLGVAQALSVLGLEYDSDAGRQAAAGMAAAVARGVRLGIDETGLANCLTAIEPQPRLAALANATSDGIEPLPGATASADARRGLRLAVQPWIDAPIDTPVDGLGQNAVAAAAAPQQA